MAEMITPSSSDLQRFKVVSKCIISVYQQQLKVLRRLNEDRSLKIRLRRDIVRSSVQYLSFNLKNLELTTIKNQRNCNFRDDEEETTTLRNYLSDLNNMVNLLDESAQLDVNGMIHKVITADNVMSQSIFGLLKKISSIPNECISIDNKVLDIISETGYAFNKCLIFTLTHLHFATSFERFTETSAKLLIQLFTTLSKFRDEILVREFIYYTERSLLSLFKYIFCTVRTMENESSSNEIGALQSIIYNYTTFYITTISTGLSSENPVDKILDSFNELKDQHLIMLEEITRIVGSNWTDNEPNGIIYHVILFFTEIGQNMICIEEYGEGFRTANV